MELPHAVPVIDTLAMLKPFWIREHVRLVHLVVNLRSHNLAIHINRLSPLEH
jgi:hypothetical protein